MCVALWQSASTQSPLRRITNTPQEGINLNPSISGDGRFIGFESTEDVAAAGGVDAFRAIRANVAVDPATFLQMGASRAPAPAISQDGSRIAFASKDNPLGTNADANSEIFLYDGAKLIQVTNTSPGDASLRVVNGSFMPSISDDGRFIAFSSNRNLTAQNSDGNLEIFIFDTVSLGFAQLTNSSGVVGASDAKISGNGQRVAYIRDTGATASARRDLLSQNRTGPPDLRVLASSILNLAMTYGRAISDDGQRVVWSAETATNTTQVFLFDGRNSNVTRQLTSLGARATDVPLHPTISGNGSRVAFATRRAVSGAGSNSDTSVELYTFDIPSNTIGRVTNVNSSSATADVVSSLNDDGSLIVFNYPRILSGPVSNDLFANNSEIYLSGTPVAPSFGNVTILNRASMGHEPSSTKAVAPDSIAVALGTNLANGTEQAQPLADGSFPLTVRGTSVTVNGRRAQIFFVSPTEVHFHVPAATEIGTAEVIVTNSDGFQNRGSVTTLRSAPGIFTKSGDGLGEAMVLNADTLTSGPFDPSSGNLRLLIFATGVRNGQSISVTAGGRPLTLESIVAATNMPGMDELHVLVPADLRGAGRVDLVVRSDGRDSNPTTIDFTGDARRDVLVNEFLADPPDGAAGDANRDGTRDTSADEFIELVNTTNRDLDISGYQILTRGGTGTSDTLRHTFPTGSVIPACSALVVFGGGNIDAANPAFGGAQVVKASTGSLTLINASGVITLRDAGGNIASFVAYGGSTGLDSDDNQSLTRAPDITGAFAKHGAATGGARLFSPGTQLTGDPFPACTAAIARIEVSPSSATIIVGQQQQFTARAFDSNNQEISGVIFSWQSSDTSVATINQAGLATGQSAGSTQIRATGRGVQSAPATLIVNLPPPVLTSVTISPLSVVTTAGTTLQFIAQAKDQFGQDLGGVTISFASNNPAVASVDSTSATSATGSATATVRTHRSGVAEIHATATSGSITVTSGPATILVEPGPGELLISEFRTRGPSGAADEFVEIYNPTASPIPIGGLKIRASNGSGTISDRVTISAGIILNSGCHYLVANSGSGGYSGSVTPDQTYGTGLTDDGGIAITSSNGSTIIDAVGMSNGSAYREGTPLAPLSNNVNQSYERKPGGAFGNGIDTNNNSADFKLNADTSNPQNSASGCLDLSNADLSITKSASPNPVFIGSAVTYTIVVTNNGAGAAESVVITDNLPANVTFVSCASSGTGICGGAGNNRTISFTSLSSGSSETVTIMATANGPSGTVSNTATVSSATPDNNSSNNSATANTVVQAPPPALSINDVSVSEGNAGTTTATFNVTLSAAASTNITFDIATQDGTATAASGDYVSRTLTSQTIPAGQQSFAFTVDINGDTLVESDETFFVNVTNVSGAVVADGQGLGTILNDDVAGLVISQVYAGGGNSGAQFTNDFVEVFNRGTTTIDFAVTPYSVQYAGATANFGSSKVDLTAGTVLPGRYFLVQLSGGSIGAPLPAPDATGSIAMAATAGKVALASGTTALSGTGCPLSPNVADFVGYGTTANCFEGLVGPAPAPSNTTADFRRLGGCIDTNDNAADFLVRAPEPRNSSSPANDCSVPLPTLSITDVSVAEGDSGIQVFTFTVNLSSPARPDGVTFDIATQDNSATTANNDYVSRSLLSQNIPAGQQTFTFDVTVNGDVAVETDEVFFVNVSNVSGATIADGQGAGTILNDDLPALSINDVTLSEGNSGTKLFNFTVSLSGPLAKPVVFDISTQDGTATVADNDYVAQSLTAQTIPAGQQTYTFSVVVNGDIKVESNETFFVNLTNISGAPVADGQGAGNIQNEDSAALRINDVAQNEGNAGDTIFTFTVTASMPAPAGGITFNIATQNQTATTAGNDYVAKSLTNQTIAAGETTYTFTVTVNGDTLVEPDETFAVNLSNVVNATVMDSQGIGTIRNDDSANLVISQLYPAGGNSGAPFTNDFVEIFNRGTTTVNFAVTPYSVQYAGATANFGSNKADLTSGTILPGHYYLVQLSGGSNGAPLPTPDATGSIAMAAGAGKVALVVGTTSLPVSICPGDDGVEPFNPNHLTIVDFVGYGSTAACYEGPSQATTPTNTTADFRGNGGCTDTNNNQADFLIATPAPRNSSSPANNCTFGALPQLSINDLQGFEGTGSQIVFTFTVSLSSPSSSDIFFDIATANNTAGNTDYTARSLTTQIIPAGQLTYTFDVPITNDSVFEPDETFFVFVSNVTGANVIDNQGVGTILNDDAPLISISDVTLTEGDSGTREFNFVVSLSGPAPPGEVSFDIRTADGTATTLDNDYVARALDGQVMAQGQQTFTFTVTVNGDVKIEPNETFGVRLLNVHGATVQDGEAVGTILNDDTPALSVTDVTVTEGDSGTVIATFTVTSSLPAPPSGITFNITTQDGTATAASGDYVAKTLTNQVIPAGMSSYTFDVIVNGDTLVESDETFFVKITPVSGATTADATGQGTIQNDDVPLVVVSQLYGGGGNVGSVFKNDFIEIFNRGTTTVNLAGWSVQYASATGSSWSVTQLCSPGPCLLQPGQYFLVQEDQGSGGTTNLPAPDATGSIAMTTGAGKVALVQNTTALSGTCPSGANILDLVGYGATASCSETSPAPAPSNTVSDVRKGGGCVDTNNNSSDFFTHAASPRNSSFPLNTCNGQTVDLSINDVTVTENDSGTVTAVFTVTLHGSTGSTVTVDYSTADDSAIAPGDYQSITAQQLVFNPGDVTKTINVTVNGDTLDEPNETFFVNLFNATNAALLDNQGVGTITDNDVPPSLSINDVSISEGNSSTTFTFTVQLSAPALTGGVTFDIATQDGTAQDDNPASEDNDYVAQSITGANIPAGSQTYMFSVTVNGDLVDEPNETFFVNVTNVVGATETDGQGQGTIQNDDSPALSINDVTQTETNGVTTFNFTVSSTLPAPAGGITFQVTTSDGTAQDDNPATEDNDYVPQTGVVYTILATQTSVTVPITVNGDTKNEAICETFFVNLSNPTNASIADPQGQGGITDDDGTKLVISQIYGGGGNSGAFYRNDFIEIFNRGDVAINLSGMSVQYAASTGTTWSVTPLGSVNLQPGQYYLVQEAGPVSGFTPLPTPDATGTIVMAATAGKVALVTNTTALSGACPSGATILDMVGYGGAANCFEGTGPAPAPGNNTSDARLQNGCTDANNNPTDFATLTPPNPRNTLTATSQCSCSTSYSSLWKVLETESSPYASLIRDFPVFGPR